MAITIDGAGTITGLAVGGLPDGVVDGDMLASGTGGKVIQVVSSTKTSAFTSSSTSYVDITGVTASITPASASNHILVLIQGGMSNTGDGSDSHVQLLRDSTVIGSGDAGGSSQQSFMSCQTSPASAANRKVYAVVGTWKDSPSSTSSVTYKLQIKSSGATGTWNRSGVQGTYYGNTASSIVLMEIGA